MKAHQRIIREECEASGSDTDLFGRWWEELVLSLKDSVVRPIDVPSAALIVEKYEWLGYMPKVHRYCFGHFFSGCLGGVCVLGDPMAVGAFSKIAPGKKVIHLNRGVHLWWTPPNSASFFISKVCAWLKQNTDYEIVSANCDERAGEIGTIYQSGNWRYLGKSSGDKIYVIHGKEYHPRTIYDLHGTRSLAKIKATYGDAFSTKKGEPKHRYVLPLYRGIKIPSLPYPKRAEEVSSRDTVGTPDRAGGSSQSPLQDTALLESQR